MIATESRVAAAVVAALLGLTVVSLFLGVSEITPVDLLRQEPQEMLVFLASRVPRLASVLLAGASMSVAGLIMQHLTRNRFVAPSTAGTVDAAGLGVIIATIFLATAPILVKITVSTVFALAATFLFLAIVRRVRFKDVIFVPLVGLMFGGVLRGITQLIAYRADLLQTLETWLNGDFSGILRGRYETLYLAAVVAVIAYVFADRLTLVGMGETFATNLGVSYHLFMNVGLGIVAMVTAVVVVTVGAIPFLGLIVPNVATLILGDNLRRVLPIAAAGGAAFVLAADMIGRLIIHPYEIPVGTVVGVSGAAVFLWLVLRTRHHAYI